MPEPSTIPHLALAQYHQRKRFWQRQRAEGKCTAEEADARLYPWLAVAVLAGADLAAIDLRLVRQAESWRGGALDLGEAQARALVADDHCPRAEALAMLANSRDAALDQLARNDFPNTEAAQRAAAQAAALAQIAHHLHAPPYAGSAFAERKAA